MHHEAVRDRGEVDVHCDLKYVQELPDLWREGGGGVTRRRAGLGVGWGACVSVGGGGVRRRVGGGGAG